METFTNCMFFSIILWNRCLNITICVLGTDLSLNYCDSDTVSDFLLDHDHQEKSSIETLSLSGDSNSRSFDDALFLFDDACKFFESEIDFLPTDILHSDNTESKSDHWNDNLKVATGFWPNDDKCTKENWQTNFGILCSKCDQKFISKLYFDKHFLTDHSGSDLIYTCSCCRKQFQNYSSFRSHCYRHYKSKMSKCVHFILVSTILNFK